RSFACSSTARRRTKPAVRRHRRPNRSRPRPKSNGPTVSHGRAAFERKIRAPETLAAGFGGASRPLVFTNGVFDILHRGHATYLAQARTLGSALVVALNSDASARGLGKGADRPVNPLADRL